MRKALLVVDVQRDFCPGGILAIKGGDNVVPKLNKVIEAFVGASLPVFLTRDWHPPDHLSFKAAGGIWPPHCVKGTPGAEFHPKLKVPWGSVVISKGEIAGSEAYSAFQGTDLEKRLRKLGTEEVLLGGLATDYCVKESALDALAAGLKVMVLRDGVRGVNLRANDSELALKEVVAKGARLITSSDAVRLVSRRTGERSLVPKRPRSRPTAPRPCVRLHRWSSISVPRIGWAGRAAVESSSWPQGQS